MYSKSPAESKSRFESELEEYRKKPEPKRDSRPEEAGWTVFGAALQGPPPRVLIANSTAAPAGENAEQVASGEGTDLPGLPVNAAATDRVESGNMEISGASAEIQAPEEVSTQQKSPVPAAELTPALAEIAELKVEGMEIPHGMVGAKQAVMAANPKHRVETAEEEAGAPIDLDYIESAAFEQPITIQPIVSSDSAQSRNGERKDAPEALFALDGHSGPEANSRFELSESADVGAARPVETISTIEAIRTQVQVLRVTGQEKLDVIVRPDGQTELFVQVTRVDGQLQVQVRCERGDFALLEAHWNTVQSSLAGQGIKVEALEPGAQFGSSMQSNTHSEGEYQAGGEKNPSREEARTGQDNFTAEKQNLAKRPMSAARPTTAVAGVRGWQSWA